VDNQNKNITENYYRFDVLQLLDILREDSYAKNIFFETDPSFAFPPGDISAIDIRDPLQATIRLPMMNLLGITTPLPIGLTDYANRDRKGSEPLQAFLSIMQNRIHQLWIDALRKYKIWRDTGNPAMRLFEKLSARLLEQFEVYDLFWLPSFSRKTRSADDLKRVIQSIWKGIPVRVEENIGRWTSVENRRPLGRGLRLGGYAVVIGSRVFDRTAKFRISLGPLDIDTYRSLLPDLSNYLLLRNILCAYINEPLICELEISCHTRDLDPARLAEPYNKPEKNGGLGRTTVLGRKRDGNGGDEVHRYRTIIFENFIVPASPPHAILRQLKNSGGE
jgi:type VI secretion system protein ImpH